MTPQGAASNPDVLKAQPQEAHAPRALGHGMQAAIKQAAQDASPDGRMMKAMGGRVRAAGMMRGLMGGMANKRALAGIKWARACRTCPAWTPSSLEALKKQAEAAGMGGGMPRGMPGGLPGLPGGGLPGLPGGRGLPGLPRPAERQELIPRLETERLVLRALTQADFRAAGRLLRLGRRAFRGRPDGSRHGLAPCRGFGRQLGVRGFGEFAVEEKASGKFAGLIGPWFPEGWPEQEIGWIVLPEFQGQGYGREAA